MTTLAVTLRDEHRQFIEAEVQSGRYVSESDVVAEALAELKAREELRQVRLAEWREKIAVGVAQLDRGEGVEWNAAAVREQGAAILAARQSEA